MVHETTKRDPERIYLEPWCAFLAAMAEFEAAANLWADPEGPSAEDMAQLRRARQRVIECARALATIRPEAQEETAFVCETCDEATGYLAEIAGTLADMHDGEECRFEGGEGCLACYAQGRIGEMQDALAAARRGEGGE